MKQEKNDWSIDLLSYKESPDLNYPKVVSKELNTKQSWKMLYFKILLIITVGFMLISLVNLQVVNGASFKKLADNNSIHIESIPAPRGIIYDKNGIPLVYNKSTFKVVLSTYDFDLKSESHIFTRLSNILNISKDELVNKYDKGIKDGAPLITLKDNITKAQMIEISIDTSLGGIRTETSVVREYPYKDLLTHILGYVGLVDENNLSSNPSLNNLDSIGKDGIEYEYDKQLRGADGQNIVEEDITNHVVNIVKRQDPIPGSNIYLSIDINVEKNLADVLARGIEQSSATGGVALVENINDGSIIGMESLPSFDNNKFSGGISEKDYSSLLSDPNKPLINRAIGESQPPGSVMKTITASAALQQNFITKDTIINDAGTFEYGGRTFQSFRKIARGDLNVVGGLEWSSNIFFYKTMAYYIPDIENFIKYEDLFGLGSVTGVDLPGEVKGVIASPEEKQRLTKELWYGGDSLNAVIGQGDTTVTPIQAVNWITSIANGGTLFQPRLASKVLSYDNKNMQIINTKIQRQGFVSDQNLSLIKEGMHDAVKSGIDRTLYTPVVDVAAKTGTAEFGPLDSQGNALYQHAWATGFAPFDKPQIAFVVFLEKGGLSTSSETVAKNFLNWYYGSYLKQ